MRHAVRFALAVVALLLSQNLLAQTDLFSLYPNYPGISPLPPSGRRAVIAEFPVAINVRTVAQSPKSLRVRLPDGSSHVFSGQLEPSEGFIFSSALDSIPDPNLPDSALSYSWFGTSGRQSLNFTVRRGYISGTLIGPSGNASITRRGNQLVFRQYDSSQVVTDEAYHAELSRDVSPSAYSEAAQAVASQAFIPNSVIKVLVFHTPAALADVGSQAQLNALVAESLDQTNQSIRNSGIINYRLENVYSSGNLSTLINYSEQNSNVCDPDIPAGLCRYVGHRNWLRRSATAQSLRNSTKADVVVMLVADVEWAAGVAYVQHPNCAIEVAFGENTAGCGVGASFNDFAYSVVSTQFATSYQVFAHENGHQLGMEHNRPYGSDGASFNWSYGYVVNGVGQSLLGVSQTLPTRALQYSNPNVNFLGTTVPSGTAQEWNARTGASLAGFVGEFRDPQYQNLIFGAGFEALPLE